MLVFLLDLQHSESGDDKCGRNMFKTFRVNESQSGWKFTARWTASRNWLFEFNPLFGFNILPRGTLIPCLNAVRVRSQVSVFLQSTITVTSDSLQSDFMKTHISWFSSREMMRFLYFCFNADSGWKRVKSLISSFFLNIASCLSSLLVFRGAGLGDGRHDLGTSNSVGGSTGRAFFPFPLDV